MGISESTDGAAKIRKRQKPPPFRIDPWMRPTVFSVLKPTPSTRETEIGTELFPTNPDHPSDSKAALLLVVAAPAEAAAIRAGFGHAGKSENPGVSTATGWLVEPLAPGVDMIVTGVGKAQAAGGVIHALDPARHDGVLSIGIGGLLSQNAGPDAEYIARIGDAILADRSVFADEGLDTPSGFQPLHAMGFPPGLESGGFCAGGMPCSPQWRDSLRRVCDGSGVIATLSSCSGTDASAQRVVQRTGALVENMEGAAVAAALSRLPASQRPLFAEIRVVSNTTGDREKQVWDLPGSLRRLGLIAAEASRVGLACLA